VSEAAGSDDVAIRQDEAEVAEDVINDKVGDANIGLSYVVRRQRE
jgi:hypothetical protein